HVVAAEFPELEHNRLKDRCDTDRLVDPGADIADPELEGRVVPTRPDIPPDLRGIGNRPGGHKAVDHALELGPGTHRPGNAGAGEIAEHDAAVTLEPGVAAEP